MTVLDVQRVIEKTQQTEGALPKVRTKERGQSWGVLLWMNKMLNVWCH